MKIYRNGCEFELTEEELAACAREYNKLKQRKRTEKITKQTEEKKSWQEFCKTEGKKRPYPENMLFDFMLQDQSGMEYVTSPIERKQDILDALTWAISSLPVMHRKVLELCYRDNMSLKECAQYLTISASKASQLKEKARNLLRKPIRYSAIQAGLHDYRESFPLPGENGYALREKIRHDTLCSDGFVYYRFRYVSIRSLGLTMDTVFMLLRNEIMNATDLQRFLASNKLADLDGVTPEIIEDIQDALRFIDEHSFGTNK